MKKIFGILAAVLALVSSSNSAKADGLNLVTVIGQSPYGFRVIFEATDIKVADATVAALSKCQDSGSIDCRVAEPSVPEKM